MNGEIILKLRSLIDDNLIETGYFVDQYTTSNVFTLIDSHVSSIISVYVNQILLGSGTWSFDSTSNRVTIYSTLDPTDLVEIYYTYTNKYSDNELNGWIRAALSYLSIEKYKTFKLDGNNEIFPTPTEAEENLIAVIAAILIKCNISSYRTPELSVSFFEKETKDEKIGRVIAQFKKCFGDINYCKIDSLYTQALLDSTS